MHETRRLLEAASALSAVLQTRGVPHAFYGDVLISLLANQPLAAQISCIVQGGTPHPFRLVRDALRSAEDFSTTSSPWSDRLHVKYHRFIPPIEIEILSAGEEGPRRLDANTIMNVRGLPFLSVAEYIRAKLKSWTIRQSEPDAREITYLLNRYWDKIDINRIPEQDMNDFAAAIPDASRAWASLQKKYGI
ncbi:hypothetical protein BJ322DRAFT_1106156 [Thelephora terrestris]|uniref:Uncharacterized protein n=1 Tax=Thelephora terrestris TaxID=56493 RepID=A0A9P6HJE3_9AGAM|nr:hypothetical protein BJ322DRAFT_1106156 [Thelephora terrestris]